ncbi:protein O-mannosyl-transferase Tmtc3 [Trichonephila clavata]|uniref:Protein O-mannosyl-transferase Tmtc3 n=1 Tax=Trichonephila clavata TaxID=2740835 RepID=A0A8X6F9N8_TRICU|nr:protein O-mannosyl-transferase Tmtc3 [Trichonephila clavata]
MQEINESSSCKMAYSGENYACGLIRGLSFQITDDCFSLPAAGCRSLALKLLDCFRISLPCFDFAESVIGRHYLPSFALYVVFCGYLYLPTVLTSLHVDASLLAPGSTSPAYSSCARIPASAPTLQASLIAITHRICRRRPVLVWSCLLFLICIHTSKTVRRNADWQNEHSLFLSGLKVNQRNAKLYNNVGHCLETQGKFSEALSYFNTAIEVEPNDIGAYINVGRTHTQLGMYEEAEKAFRKAKDLLPKPPFGEGYEARVAPSHLNVFLNLANLISRNGTRLEEADKETTKNIRFRWHHNSAVAVVTNFNTFKECNVRNKKRYDQKEKKRNIISQSNLSTSTIKAGKLYQEAIRMRSDYVEAYINRGDILIRLNRTREAQDVYEKALQLDDANADIHYNLGVVFLEQRKTDLAMISFDKALKINPRHEQALLNSAILIQEEGGPNKRKTAYHRLLMLLEARDVNERVYFHLGMLAMDEKNFTLAEKWFRKAVELKSDFRSALFNLALLLSEARRPKDALPFLKQLRQYHPDHVKGLILLGDIYINNIKDLDAAQECYESILRYESNNVQALHNLCVVHVERGFMEEAEACLEKASALAPSEQYVTQHLDIVRARRLQMLKKAAQSTKITSTNSDSKENQYKSPNLQT